MDLLPHRDCRDCTDWPRKGCKDLPPRRRDCRGCKGSPLRRGCRGWPRTDCMGWPPRMDCTGSPHMDCRDCRQPSEAAVRSNASCRPRHRLPRRGCRGSPRTDCTDWQPPHRGYKGCTGLRRTDYRGCTDWPRKDCRGSRRTDYRGCTGLQRRDCTDCSPHRGYMGCTDWPHTDYRDCTAPAVCRGRRQDLLSPVRRHSGRSPTWARQPQRRNQLPSAARSWRSTSTSTTSSGPSVQSLFVAHRGVMKFHTKPTEIAQIQG